MLKEINLLAGTDLMASEWPQVTTPIDFPSQSQRGILNEITNNSSVFSSSLT